MTSKLHPRYLPLTTQVLTSRSLLDQDLGVAESVADTLTRKAKVWMRFNKSPWVDNDLARRLFEGDTVHRLYRTIRQSVKDGFFQFKVGLRFHCPLALTLCSRVGGRRLRPSHPRPSGG